MMSATQSGTKNHVTRTHSRRNEIVSIILLAVGVLFFLCLVTFNPNDRSLNTSSSQPTGNLIGALGAVVADATLQTVGLVGFVLPFLMFLIAWQCFKASGLRVSPGGAFGFILFLLTLSGLLSLADFSHALDGSVQVGGIVGKFVENLFVFWLGKIGTAILLLAGCVIGFLLISNFSLNLVFTDLAHLALSIKAYFSGKEMKPSVNKGKERSAPSKAVDEASPIKQSLEERVRAWHQGTMSYFERFTEPPRETGIGKVTVSDKPLIEKKPEQKAAAQPTISGREAETAKVKPSDADKAETKPISDKSENAQADAYGLNTLLNPQISARVNDTDAAASEDAQEANMDDDDLSKEASQERSTPKKKAQSFDNYQLPTDEFLTPPPPAIEQKEDELFAIAEELTQKCDEFKVNGRVMHIRQGPVVTTYEFKPDPGVKYARITGLSDDLCLALKAESVRIDRIPGKAYVGIEVPNPKRETIHLREVVESRKFKDSASLLTIALGKKIDGENYVADLAKMPHLLIAGATGAGKSVGVNSLVVSILYKARPDEVKFIMVDPKRLELGLYADIPHLATPIITDPKRAAISLKWAVREMETRYKELAGWGVRNIDGFNKEVQRRNFFKDYDQNGDPWRTLPYIVIIIDELADLMMVSSREVEESITRLAQMARAVGIHLVLATQRPSVDVITGLIKANFPSRISFRVSSKVDSRTIIDANGAERLLGRGDMLFLPPGTSQLVRVHGAFVDEKEIARIVTHIKLQGAPEYDETITQSEEETEETDGGGLPGRRDPLFMDALKSVVSAKRASTSLLQRHLRIGYGRAAAILDAMAREGYIGDMDGSRARPILEKAYEALQDDDEQNYFS
jgi:S-DNA-T family DNA segregation ATPase FtsK/SpoIIIE